VGGSADDLGGASVGDLEGLREAAMTGTKTIPRGLLEIIRKRAVDVRDGIDPPALDVPPNLTFRPGKKYLGFTLGDVVGYCLAMQAKLLEAADVAEASGLKKTAREFRELATGKVVRDE
jgi:hypothetical protein